MGRKGYQESVLGGPEFVSEALVAEHQGYSIGALPPMLVAEHCEPRGVHSQSQQALNRPFSA